MEVLKLSSLGYGELVSLLSSERYVLGEDVTKLIVKEQKSRPEYEQFILDKYLNIKESKSKIDFRKYDDPQLMKRLNKISPNFYLNYHYLFSKGVDEIQAANVITADNGRNFNVNINRYNQCKILYYKDEYVLSIIAKSRVKKLAAQAQQILNDTYGDRAVNIL